MKTQHLEVGKKGEEIAVTYLKKMSYKIIERNYRTLFGELDIIAKQGGYLVFVEVKTRTQTVFGAPEEAIHPEKQRKLVKSAQSYLKKHGWLERPARFDVLSIVMDDKGKPNFCLIQDAFQVEGFD